MKKIKAKIIVVPHYSGSVKRSEVFKRVITEQIENVIRTYEEIVEGNYIDNLIRAERERREAEQKKENSPEQPKPTQTTNKKHNRR